MAYGARLESALSESSRGFESPILRKQNDRLSGGFFVCWGYWGGFERSLGPHRRREAATLGAILRA